MTQPLVSVLVLNWNGEEIIEENIRSILSTAYRPFEVIVVDNASTDESLDILRSFPQITVIENRQNLGYAEGNNIGFSRCRGEYIAVVNNDVVVDPEWLDAPVRTFEQFSDVGLVSCRQMNHFKRQRIDTLYLFPTFHLLLGQMGHGKVYDDIPLYREAGYVLGANGASAIYRKEVITELGGFDGIFFAYHEESDLQMRAFYAGWKCVYAPTSVVYHKGSHSFDKMKKSFFYFHERNRIWFIYRNFPLWLIAACFPIILYREIQTFLNIAVKKGFAGTYCKARLDGFRSLGRFKALRRRNMKNFKMKRRRFMEFMKKKKIPLRMTPER